MSIADTIADYLAAHPGDHKSVDIAAATGLESRQVNQTIGRLASDGSGRVVKVGYGRYVAGPMVDRRAIRGMPRDQRAETPADLRPITDTIDDDVFKGVGLRPVGMAADGSRVCVDDQGSVWRVRVTVEARMV